jgi:hypothetical protein
MMVYHSTEIAGFHLETEIQYMLPRRHKLISWKTTKTPDRGLENKQS